MNRNQFEQALFKSGLDWRSKAVLLYYAHCKNWKKNGVVWVSAQTVSSATGLSVRTVERKIPLLRDLGWLVDTGGRKANGKGRPSIMYDLNVGETVTESVKVQAKNRQGDGKGEELNRQTDDTLPSNEQDFTVKNEDFTVTVTDEQGKNMNKEHVREQESTTTDSDEPVVEVEEPLVREDAEYLGLLHSGVKTTLLTTASFTNATPQQTAAAAKTLFLANTKKWDYASVADALEKEGVEIEEW